MEVGGEGGRGEGGESWGGVWEREREEEEVEEESKRWGQGQVETRSPEARQGAPLNEAHTSPSHKSCSPLCCCE